MKKTLFILFIIVLLGACLGENEFDDVTYTIINESLKTVSFTFNDILETLDTGGSITYNINSEKCRFALKDITFLGHPRSINLTTLNKGTAGIFYTFSDNIPLALNIENKLSIPVTIKADDFLAATDDTDDEKEFTLKIKEKETKTAFIYTSTPKFLVKESDESERTLDPVETGIYIPYPYPYPINIDWNLMNDNTINLTIK